MTDREPEFLSVAEAAAFFAIGRSAFYEHFLTPKRLPVVRVGKRVLIHRRDLEHLAEELRAEAVEEAARHADEIARLGETLLWNGPSASDRERKVRR